MQKILSTSLGILISLFIFSVSSFSENTPEISQDDRQVAAQKVLSETAQAVTVYVKGLCCPSCAIGIRKKVSKLDFIDTTRLNKGVDLDTKTQLATVTILKGAVVNPFTLAQAIRDAGYDPAHLYQLKSGEVQKTEMPQEAK